MVSLSLGDQQEVLDGIVSFEVYLYTKLTANILEAFTQPFSVRYYHVDVIFLIVIWFVIDGSVYVVLFLIFNQLKSPGGITAPLMGPHYMFLFTL